MTIVLSGDAFRPGLGTYFLRWIGGITAVIQLSIML
jgi:hypothetical protein